MCQADCIGFIQGVRKYDLNAETIFLGYIGEWEKVNTEREISKTRFIRLPENVAYLNSKIYNYERKIEQEEGRTVTTEEILRERNLIINTAKALKKEGYKTY